jgi:hypothetical protein
VQSLLQQALSKQDGAMVTALVSNELAGVAAGMGSGDLLKHLQAAIGLEYEAAAAVQRLGSLVNTSSSWSNSSGIRLQERDLEGLLVAAMQQGPTRWEFIPVDAEGKIDEHASVAACVVRLPAFEQLSKGAIARLLKAAVKQEVPGVVEGLCELPEATELCQAVVMELFLDACKRRFSGEAISSLQELHSRIMLMWCGGGGYAESPDGRGHSLFLGESLTE